MNKKILTIRIEVDLDKHTIENWESQHDYFDDEIDNALNVLTSIKNRPFNNESIMRGTTKTGSQFNAAIKRVRQ